MSHFLALAWQRDQGQTLAILPPKAWPLQIWPSGSPEKPNCTDCLKPEARTADSSAITLPIRLREGFEKHSPLANAQQNATETDETLFRVES